MQEDVAVVVVCGGVMVVMEQAEEKCRMQMREERQVVDVGREERSDGY